MAAYPLWKFYPSRLRPPAWVAGVVGGFTQAQSEIDSTAQKGMTSDMALAAVRPYLLPLGFEVESGKRKLRKSDAPFCSASSDERTWRTRSMVSSRLRV